LSPTRDRRRFVAKFQIMIELLAFLKEARKLWLIPIVIVLLLLSIIIILGETTALGPLIYTLF
jgi:hypothetical protein